MTLDDSARDKMTKARYAGLPTFMRAPYVESLDGLDIALIGVPFDGGLTNRPGARHGPREVRNLSSMMRLANSSNRIEPYELVRIADVGDAYVEKPYHLEPAHDEIQRAFEPIKDAGVTPLAVGGDHSISLPILRVMGRIEPVGLIHIDAHCDTGDEYYGSRFHHGAPFSRAVEEGVLDPERTVQIGIRGTLNDLNQWKFSYDHGMRVIRMDEVRQMGIESVIKEARRVVGDGPTYLSFDIDALDPAYAPGTGTPEIGGFTSYEGQLLVRGLLGVNLIGADLVEVSPPFDHAHLTSLAGASLMFEILCILADAVSRR
ncbi:MAG: agmatinase [Rhodospirillaceae bacterium]|nr:agmatinase [Rhodospirillaceae bacterium]